MGMIQTGIELQDQFSNAIVDFANGMMAATNAAVNFQNVMNQNISTSGLNGVQSEIQSVMNDLNELSQTASIPVTPIVSDDTQRVDFPANPVVARPPERNISDSLNAPVTPVVPEQPQGHSDMDVQGVQRFNAQIEQTQTLLQRVSDIQDIINTESRNLGVLPDDARGRVRDVNERLLQMQEAMNQISQNPFDMPTETIEAELASLQNRIRQTVQEQLELNETLSNMDIEMEQPPPVQIPVEWQTDNLDVFTNSGVERFRQEVQSANNMLEQLSGTQNEIARQASNTNVLPPQAAQNMTNLATRIDGVRERIQRIENNPLNIGTDRVNSELERLRSQLSQAVQQQDEMNSAIDRMDVSGANAAYLQLSQTIGYTESYIRDNVNEQGAFNDEINRGTENANGLMTAIKGVVAAYATVNTLKSGVGISDELVQTTSRLNMMNDGLQSTPELLNMTYLAAQNARGEFGALAGVVARFGNNAGDAFSGSEEVVQFAELIQKQMTIAGASTQEASNAMLQLSQALGSGVLRGDELNSIFEQAPNLIRGIAAYIEQDETLINSMADRLKMGSEDLRNNVMGHIRDIASEGMISADIVKASVFAATDQINADFESMPVTWGQVLTSMQNTAKMEFQPVLQKINDVANSDRFQAFSANVIHVMALAAGAVLRVFDLIGAVGQFTRDHWDVLSPVIYTVIGALAAYIVYLGIARAAEIASVAIKTVLCVAQYAYAASTGTAVAATAAHTAAQLGLNTALLACPLTWIIVAIIALIAIVIAVTRYIAKMGVTADTAFGVVCGAVYVVGAVVRNVAIGVINAVIQAVWTVAESILWAVEWVLNVANGGFDSFGGAVANLIGQIISGFLSLGKVVTRIIDAIFGTDWTSGLTRLQDTVLSWGKTDQAITLNRDAPVLNLDRADYADAYRNGAKVGDDIAQRANAGPQTEFYERSISAAAVANANAETAKNTGDTAKAAQKAVQSLDVTNENLKYIKDMAEREYINRFSTTRINVKQTNHNTVNKNMDLDGVNEYLRSDIEKRMAATAEGVH